MSEALFGYQRLEPTSWAYLASLLVIALYFKFSRFWSVRNLDLLILILLAPALLLIKLGMEQRVGEVTASHVEHAGYIWLFSVGGLFMLRLLLDPAMVRRPLLEPNLSVGGLTFLGVALFTFLTANVMTGSALSGNAAVAAHAPGLPLLNRLPHIETHSVLGSASEEATDAADSTGNEGPEVGSESVSPSDSLTPQTREGEASESGAIPLASELAARIGSVAAQLAIIVGLMLVAMRHFDNIRPGVAAATLYLLLPYTSMWMGNVVHALPGALLVWAFVLYRRPLFAGVMIGLAIGVIGYAAFVLPLWISFYWQRGISRFLLGTAIALGALVAGVAYFSNDTELFLASALQMIGMPTEKGLLTGAWQFWNPVFRYPIAAAFVGLSLSLVLWPAQKNLGNLIACSAVVMLGTQFWHGQTGGLAIAWYLPALLLTIFRPNLEDRTSLAVVR
jgi:hypothetical protein